MRILTARSWLTFRTTSRVSLYAPMLRPKDHKTFSNSIRNSSLIWQVWIEWTRVLNKFNKTILAIFSKIWTIVTRRMSLTPISRWAQILSIRWSRKSKSTLLLLTLPVRRWSRNNCESSSSLSSVIAYSPKEATMKSWVYRYLQLRMKSKRDSINYLSC